MSTKLITFRHRVAGVLTNATSVKLSDPTGAYGLRRVSNSAVVVADGTDFTNGATGIYTYDVTGLADGVAYDYWIEWVYAGATHRNNRTFTTPAAGVTNAGTTGMTLTQARSWVRFYARDAAGDDSTYTDAVIDFALQAVLEQFCRVTKCVRTTSDLAVLTGVATVDTSGLSGFHPERIVNARLDGETYPLARPDYAELVRLQQTQGGTGAPTSLAFEDGVTDEGGLHYTPDANYTLKLSWYQPFTTWTPGVVTATADTIMLNCPPDLLLRVLPFGPPSMLQHTDPKMRYASESWQKYLLVEKELTGAKLTGARTSRRNKASW